MPPVCPNGHGIGTTRGSVGMAGTLTYRSMSATADRICTWYIRHVDVFRHLAPHDADDLARAMTLRRFSPEQRISSAETQPELVCVTRAGTVRMFQPESDGRETTVERLFSGHLFGVTSLLPGDAGRLLAQAETDVERCSVEGQRFLDVISRWPAAALELALRLGVRVREGEEL